jgi:hypothetical protein
VSARIPQVLESRETSWSRCVETLAATAAHGGRVSDPRPNESLALHAVERRIDASERSRSFRGFFETLLDANRVGFLTKRANAQQDQLLELSQTLTLGHNEAPMRIS